MELIYYNPYKLYSYQNISSRYPEQHAFSKMFNASISLIDRSCTINCPPVPCKILDPIHVWEKTPSFAELCQNRYQELLDECVAANKTMVIFYSGGIDSTLIAALAISHRDFEKNKKHILLAFNEDSIKENPAFWNDFLIPKFKERITSSSNFNRYISDNRYMCVTGEFADNIFGSLALKNYMDVTGDTNAIHKSFQKTGMQWILNKITNTGYRDACESMINQIMATSTRPLSTNHDCFWWLNFILKWQAVKFRLVSHATRSDLIDPMIRNIVHFFETTNFQNWSVTTEEDKVTNDWRSYKMPAKTLIYSINHDEHYLKYKTKYPSIPSLTRYSNMYDFIYYDNNTNKYVASKEIL